MLKKKYNTLNVLTVSLNTTSLMLKIYEAIASDRRWSKYKCICFLWRM